MLRSLLKFWTRMMAFTAFCLNRDNWAQIVPKIRYQNIATIYGKASYG